MKLKKPKRTRKQGTEWQYECPSCGQGSKNEFPFEINIVKAVARCLRCGYTLPEDEAAKLYHEIRETRMWMHLLPESNLVEPRGEVVQVPKFLHRVMEERGFDPDWLINVYNVGWDGSRLCFPVGEGYWRRAVYPGQEPKVIMDDGTRTTILGEHLLGKEDWIVLTEGDYGAASIPRPYKGCAIGGAAGDATISQDQVEVIQFHQPQLVYVMMDGGVNPDQIVNTLAANLVPVVPVIGLPEEQGPDDVSVIERLHLLEDSVEWEED